MLHTLHRSPWLTDFAALLRLLSEGDELLLLQDGVTAAVDGNRYLESLRNAPIKVYALNEDLIARGLTGQISNDIILIDYKTDNAPEIEIKQRYSPQLKTYMKALSIMYPGKEIKAYAYSFHHESFIQI